MTERRTQIVRWLLMISLAWLGAAVRMEAQIGALVSPGPLAKVHATLEGAANCQKCHERGRKVTVEKCLTCHTAVAQRIQQQRGIHKGATECVTCHVDHAGVDGELRPFDTTKFNHAAVTGFALDGKHAPVAAQCASCHKTRSFLTAAAACASCHSDVHKGSLGANCQSCHSTSVAFAAARSGFNHDVTKFPLAGAHRRAACASCHLTSGTFKVAKFGACADCHRTPHPPAMSTTCTSCHTTDNWKTRRFDHSQTAFPLKGEHANVACESCHKQPATKVKPPSATCSACHVDTHKGEFKQDCKTCHSETGWSKASFDHQAGTSSRFALTDGHAGLTCRSCHTNLMQTASLPPSRKVADFRGQRPACASCHADVHQTELGQNCESCHSPKTFAVTAFTHTGAADFYGGQHAALTCAKCHQRAGGTVAATARPRPPGPPLAATKHTQTIESRFKGTSTTCATCHADPHLGQVGADCQSCHSVSALKFVPDRFAHERSAFQLIGKHRSLACAACHKTETAAFPEGQGTATRFKSIGTTCASCHSDVHLGQVSARCDSCHSNDTFTLQKYEHSRSLASLFVGSHKRASCQGCHKIVTATFPAGRGTAVQFKVGTRCVSCHEDVHRGAMGADCAACHRPAPLAASHLVQLPGVTRSGVSP